MAKTPEAAGTALINWDEQLKKDAAIASGMETNAAGSFFSLRGGLLSFNEQTYPGNQLAVIVLDSMYENVYYTGAYNPEVISPPSCFAFGREEGSLAPHRAVLEVDQAESTTCEKCPRNEWGSAAQGRGKACSNRRRLSCLPAGTFDRDTFVPFEPEYLATSPVGLLKLPVTSGKGFGLYLRQVANVYERPLYGVVSLMKVVPDPKTQFKVVFTMIGKCPNEMMPIIVRRRMETKELLEQPYRMEADDAAPARAPAQPPTRGARGAATPGLRDKLARAR
jgi:hypothetical protein